MKSSHKLKFEKSKHIQLNKATFDQHINFVHDPNEIKIPKIYPPVQVVYAPIVLQLHYLLIIHLSFAQIWIMITLIESLGLTQSNLVDYSQLVGIILIKGFGCCEHFTMGRSDRCEKCRVAIQHTNLVLIRCFLIKGN